MLAFLPRVRAFLIAGVVLATAGFVPAPAPTFHFALVKSAPADGASVANVIRVDLWFSEPPTAETVAIHIVDADGNVVPGADAKVDAKDPKAYSAVPRAALAPGGYTVSWKGMGDDGHVVRGTFAFTVPSP